ncbi:hypothetical protein LTR53_013838 [Teratosphaeriaceae sp. CCFEE 6253]|nr:hypothetical protein LTR53_013838 [Teratosphaeriaceae sp. CCFEE 6253]
MYGRIEQRLDQFPETDRDNFALLAPGCLVMGLANYAGLSWIVVWLKRQELRRAFNIRGNDCTDCLSACFCHCCALAQMEMELKDRAAGGRDGTGAKAAQAGYVQEQPAMRYQVA